MVQCIKLAKRVQVINYHTLLSILNFRNNGVDVIIIILNQTKHMHLIGEHVAIKAIQKTQVQDY